MKVTSKNIIKKFTPFFEKRGFAILKTEDGAIFFKIIDNQYVLMYSNQISNRYSERYTFNIGLLPTFEISLSLPDLPPGTTGRIARYLESVERQMYLPEEFHKSGVVDGWWYDLNQDTVANLEAVIELIEPRFLNRIIKLLDSSHDLTLRIETFVKTIEKSIQARIPIDPSDELFIEIVKLYFEEYLGESLKPKIILYFATVTKNFHDHLYRLKK